MVRNTTAAKMSDVEERHMDVITDLICGYKAQRTGRLLLENGVEIALRFLMFFKFVRICQCNGTPGDRNVLKF
jgi:hypothetical protein